MSTANTIKTIKTGNTTKNKKLTGNRTASTKYKKKKDTGLLNT